MEIILMLLLAAAWGVFVLPSLAEARQAKSPGASAAGTARLGYPASSSPEEEWDGIGPEISPAEAGSSEPADAEREEPGRVERPPEGPVGAESAASLSPEEEWDGIGPEISPAEAGSPGPADAEREEPGRDERPPEVEREKPVNRQPMPQSSGRATTASSREQVLARRRMALIALAVLAIATLALAVITGSWPILAVSLVIDVLLAVYIAVLLQIKQSKAVAPPPPADDEDVRIF
jgi:hypothetical protein